VTTLAIPVVNEESGGAAEQTAGVANTDPF
jgi:hypothetical protein